MYVCVYVCACMNAHTGAQVSLSIIRLHGTEVIGGCELPSVVLGFELESTTGAAQ